MRTATIPLDEYEKLKKKEAIAEELQEKFQQIEDRVVVDDTRLERKVTQQGYNATIYINKEKLRELLGIPKQKTDMNGTHDIYIKWSPENIK